MSYEIWSVNGYGICIDDIEGTTAENLLKLIEEAPKLYDEFQEWASLVDGASLEQLDADELLEWEDEFGYTGIGPIMRDVIEEKENIRLCVTDDFNGFQYLLFTPLYPWTNTTEEEASLTEERMCEIFAKYVSFLASKPVRVSYYEVENGG